MIKMIQSAIDYSIGFISGERMEMTVPSSFRTMIQNIIFYGSSAVSFGKKFLYSQDPQDNIEKISSAVKPFIQDSDSSAYSEEVVRSKASQEIRAETVKKFPQFNGYKTRCSINGDPVVITGITKRPSNLWFEALNIPTTLPASRQLFALQCDPALLRCHLEKMAKTVPDQLISFSAQGKSAQATINGVHFQAIEDLTEVYGSSVYQMTYKELWEMINSQEIFLADSFPLSLYQAMKAAMLKDRVVVLPGNDHNPILLAELKKSSKYPHLSAVLQELEKNPSQYGLDSKHARKLLGMTIYQLGSLVVKREDYRVFTDEHGCILDRKPNQEDAIRLINACGIRGLSRSPPLYHRTTIQSMFKTAFYAAEKGMIIVPAVGLGVWKGDPEIYWESFLDAILESDVSFDRIYVNPGHQKSPYGNYQGCSGEEFAMILKKYKDRYTPGSEERKKLDKIHNVYDMKTDIMQLARLLKIAEPTTVVSLLNASDPDVTFGFHVGEYVNNVPHVATTEENYTAIGSNGLLFEQLTDVHNPTQERVHTCSS